MDQAGLIRTAKDLVKVARDFTESLNALEKANKDLQTYCQHHAQEVPLDLYLLISEIDVAVSGLF